LHNRRRVDKNDGSGGFGDDDVRVLNSHFTGKLVALSETFSRSDPLTLKREREKRVGE
jgi:hypothetical protein